MSRHHRPSRARRTMAALALVLAATSAFAAFPERPIRLIVPFAPGGGTDLIARTLAAGMAQSIGQPVLVENKPGAGTIIGTDLVAKSAPDGHTLVVASFAHAVNPSLQPKLPFDPDRAFAPVVLIGRGPNVLVVRADSPLKSVADVVDAARRSPGKLMYASQGVGTSAHLAGEMFGNLAGVAITHVPYRGAGPAKSDLLGGQVDLFFGTAAAVGSLVESGRLRALAVTTPNASPAFKGVPTVAATVPGYAVQSWYGLYAPAGTPPEVIGVLNAAARKAAHSPEFVAKVAQEGLEVIAGEPAELERFVKAEEARWRRIVRENGIKPN